MLMDTEMTKMDETPNLQRKSHNSFPISNELNSIKNWTFKIIVFSVIGT